MSAAGDVKEEQDLINFTEREREQKLFDGECMHLLQATPSVFIL